MQTIIDTAFYHQHQLLSCTGIWHMWVSNHPKLSFKYSDIKISSFVRLHFLASFSWPHSKNWKNFIHWSSLCKPRYLYTCRIIFAWNLAFNGCFVKHRNQILNGLTYACAKSIHISLYIISAIHLLRIVSILTLQSVWMNEWKPDMPMVWTLVAT